MRPRVNLPFNLPFKPTNPDIKYLNGNKEWVTVSIGAGGYAAPLYFTTADSDVAGYKAISYTVEVAETELSGSITNQEVLFRTYLFGETIKTTVIDAGVWVANYRTKVNKAVGVTQLKFEVFLRHADNTETTLFSSYSAEINNTDYETIREESNQPAFTCVATDRLGVRIYAKTTSLAAVTIYTTVGDGHGSYFNTPLAYRHDQLRYRDKANSHPASAIQMDTLVGTPTYTSQNDFNNSFGSAGRKTGGYITKGTGSTLNVEDVTGFIKATDDDNAQLIPFNCTGVTGMAVPANSTIYVGVDWSSGVPQIVSHTSYDWNFDTNWPLGRATNDTINGAEEIYIANAPWWVTDGTTNIFQAIRSFGMVHRDENVGGFILTQTGTRNMAVSGGVLWVGVNDLTFTGLDTAVTGTFEGYWYSSTGGWQASDLTQYSVTEWNDITKATLQTLPVGKYANVWVYSELTDSTISIAMIYPQAYYNTPAQAEAKSAPDNLPAHIKEFGTLLGRIIIKQGTDAPVAVQTVFTTQFSTTVATNHASLSNLAWTSSNHTGGVSKLAGFDASGVATEYTEADYLLKDGSRTITGALTLPAGAFATPSLRFEDANCGIFKGSDGRLEFKAEGQTALQLYAAQARWRGGSVANPGFAWSDETTSGFAKPSAGVMDIVIGGTSLMNFTAGQTSVTNDFLINSSLFFADISEDKIGFGTTTPANKLHLYQDSNSDVLFRIDNPNSGTLARAGIQFRNGNLGVSEQFSLVIGGVGYTGVTSWQDAGVMFSSSALSGGFHYAAYAGGIHFQTGGYGTGYDRLKVEDALITSNVKLKFLGGILGRQTTVSAATHSLAANNVYLRVTRTTTGACTITLTTAESELGRLVIIKDAGKAGTNNITIDTEGSQLIEGSASIAIAVDKGYVALWFNGTNWDILFDKLT